VSVRGGGNTGESGNEGMGRRGDDVRLRRKRGRGGLHCAWSGDRRFRRPALGRSGRNHCA
jgi:hypothetical protein